MAHKYENILGTIGNTPVVRVNKLGPPGVHLFVKVEAFNPLDLNLDCAGSPLSHSDPPYRTTGQKPNGRRAFG